MVEGNRVEIYAYLQIASKPSHIHLRRKQALAGLELQATTLAGGS